MESTGQENHYYCMRKKYILSMYKLIWGSTTCLRVKQFLAGTE